jgi:uncharacterized protein YlxP (DUF503 family)
VSGVQVRASPTVASMSAWVGVVEFDLLLGEVFSLKQKRSVVRPLIAELKRAYAVSVAEVSHQELHRRAGVAVAVVAGDPAHVTEVLDTIERQVSGHPEFSLVSARRWLRGPED